MDKGWKLRALSESMAVVRAMCVYVVHVVVITPCILWCPRRYQCLWPFELSEAIMRWKWSLGGSKICVTGLILMSYDWMPSIQIKFLPNALNWLMWPCQYSICFISKVINADALELSKAKKSWRACLWGSINGRIPASLWEALLMFATVYIALHRFTVYAKSFMLSLQILW